MSLRPNIFNNRNQLRLFNGPGALGFSQGCRIISTTGTGFDPDQTATGFTLSNLDKTLKYTSGSGWRSAISKASCAAGQKRYFEVTIDDKVNISYCLIGISDGTYPVSYTGDDAVSYAFQDNANYWNNAISSAAPVPYGNTDIVMVAVDMVNGKVWFGLNGTWNSAGDPGAGTGEQFSGLTGTKYASASLFALNGQVTINTDGPFTYTLPTGFEALNT